MSFRREGWGGEVVHTAQAEGAKLGRPRVELFLAQRLERRDVDALAALLGDGELVLEEAAHGQLEDHRLAAARGRADDDALVAVHDRVKGTRLDRVEVLKREHGTERLGGV